MGAGAGAGDAVPIWLAAGTGGRGLLGEARVAGAAAAARAASGQ